MNAKAREARSAVLAYSALIMSCKLARHMPEVRKPQFKNQQEGTEVTSPRPLLAPDDVSEQSRASSDWSCVDCRLDGQDFCQELIGLIQAEVDERAVRYIKIITSKNKRISELKRQLADAKKQQG
jgi:hypothetical protein